jgi:hypothetical protein
MEGYDPFLFESFSEDLYHASERDLIAIAQNQFFTPQNINRRIAALKRYAEIVAFTALEDTDNALAVVADVERAMKYLLDTQAVDCTAFYTMQDALFDLRNKAEEAATQIPHANALAYSPNYPTGGWVRGL